MQNKYAKSIGRQAKLYKEYAKKYPKDKEG